MREALSLTNGFGDTAEEWTQLKGVASCQHQPNNNLFELDGTLELDGGEKKAIFTLSNVILRGCTLKNADYVLGLVLYTGPDTKVRTKKGKTKSRNVS